MLILSFGFFCSSAYMLIMSTKYLDRVSNHVSPLAMSFLNESYEIRRLLTYHILDLLLRNCFIFGPQIILMNVLTLCSLLYLWEKGVLRQRSCMQHLEAVANHILLCPSVCHVFLCLTFRPKFFAQGQTFGLDHFSDHFRCKALL